MQTRPPLGLTTTPALPSWLLLLAAWLPLPAAATYNLDLLGTPRFINTVYIDLSKVVQISKFRSSAGHDYSDDVEHCRSMKHYFIAPDETTAIVAPVSGTITLLTAEFAGTQIQIRPDAQADFTVIMFHVALNATYTVGQHVQEGQALGTHAGRVTWSDIAIRVNTPRGSQNASYIAALTDSAFARFQQRGVQSRDDLIIPRTTRDATPFQCSGQEFTKLPYPADTELFLLTGSAPPTVQVQAIGPLQAQRLLLIASLPPEADRMTGSLFVVAALPAAWNNLLLVWSAGSWKPFTSCDTAGAAYQGQMFSGMSANIVPVETDLSPLVGTQIYIGYGVGSTVKLSCEAMLKGSTFTKAMTIQ